MSFGLPIQIFFIQLSYYYSPQLFLKTFGCLISTMLRQQTAEYRERLTIMIKNRSISTGHRIQACTGNPGDQS